VYYWVAGFLLLLLWNPVFKPVALAKAPSAFFSHLLWGRAAKLGSRRCSHLALAPAEALQHAEQVCLFGPWLVRFRWPLWVYRGALEAIAARGEGSVRGGRYGAARGCGAVTPAPLLR
jgi:hypothetical protein